jgi:hypothetical protein
MDDSRAALLEAYSVVRNRYNKLKAEYRQLMKSKACPSYCCVSQGDNLASAVSLQAAGDICHVTRESTTAHIENMCLQLEKLAESVSVDCSGDLALSLLSISAHLHELAGQLSPPSQGKPITLKSDRLLSECHEVTSSSSVSNGLMIDASVNTETESTPVSGDLLPAFVAADKVTYPLPVPAQEIVTEMDHQTVEEDAIVSETLMPWTQDLSDLTEIANVQYMELRDVCRNLKGQNELLKKCVDWIVNQKACGVTYNDSDDWSLLE